MNATTRSAVRSDGKRPRATWHLRPGSPSTFLPNVAGLRPDGRRDALTCKTLWMDLPCLAHRGSRSRRVHLGRRRARGRED